MSSEISSVHFSVERLLDRPIIYPGLSSTIGDNIQGPSAIRVPDWVDNKLGEYYLYFADHKGRYIRLAYSDQIQGPWTVYTPGSLQVEQSHFLINKPEVTDDEIASFLARRARRLGGKISHDAVTEMTTPHIASPDVHVDNDAKKIVMYFHGLESAGNQLSRVATSVDGLEFQTEPQILGRTYMRAFKYGGYTYVLAMPGLIYRSRDGYNDFEAGPMLFNQDMRHSAVRVHGDTLWVFWTQVGHIPERILFSTIDLARDWNNWKESDPTELIRPEFDWEGADAPLVESVRSTAYGHVNQLRDPAILEDRDRLFLFYAVAGESGIGVAEIRPQ
jgi:hypothetical protein